MSTRTKRLSLVFFLYVVSLFIFAGLYQAIYKHNPRSFAFNSEILSAQRPVLQAVSKQEVAALHEQVDALYQLLSAIDDGTAVLKSTAVATQVTVPPGVRYQFAERAVQVSSRGAREPVRELAIFSPNGNLIGLSKMSFERSLPHSLEGCREIAIKLIGERDRLAEEQLLRMEALIDYSVGPWRYWDFLYFSAISQTTVGYGDILPNSTLIRMLVVLQVLLGYGLLVVVLNIVIAAEKNPA
jgi:hypothetical protein